MSNKNLKIYLAAPRGFCAGVDRAIEIVKKSIDKFGAPVYVRHEIVHNKHVVESLKKIGITVMDGPFMSVIPFPSSNESAKFGYLKPVTINSYCPS